MSPPKVTVVIIPGNPVAPGAEYIHGDGRGPGNPWQGAFRMISWAEFEFPANVPDDIDKTVSKVMNNSSSTRQTRIGSYVISTITDRGTFTGRVDVSKVGPCEVQVQMSMSGGVPWLVGGPQPNIDYYYNVKLLRYTQDGADHVGATIQAKHDGFPGHELFLEFNQKVLYHRSYVPLWFSSEPAGKTAYPGPVTAVNGTRALAGQYNFQDWEDKAAYRVP